MHNCIYSTIENVLKRSYLCGAGAGWDSDETTTHLAMAGWGSTRDPKSDTSRPLLEIAQGRAKIRAHFVQIRPTYFGEVKIYMSGVYSLLVSFFVKTS